MNSKNPLQHDLQRILAKAQRSHEKFAAALAAAPAHSPCKKHPEVVGTLNREEAMRTGQIGYWCPKCEDEKEEDRVRDQQTRVGVPFDVRHASFENFDYDMTPTAPNSATPVEFLRAATDLTAGKIRTLILGGTPGIGKGHLAASVINAAIRQRRMFPDGERRTARWITLHEMFATIHVGYGTRDGTTPYIAPFQKVDLLVLDEVGMTPLPKDGQELLWEVINGRYVREKLTIIMTGLGGPDLKNFLSPAVIDRLRSGGLRFLWGSWPSKRGEATNPNSI